MGHVIDPPQATKSAISRQEERDTDHPGPGLRRSPSDVLHHMCKIKSYMSKLSIIPSMFYIHAAVCKEEVKMVRPHSTLLFIVLTSSTSVEAQPGMASSHGKYHQDNLLDTLVRVLTPHNPVLSTSERGPLREPFRSASKDGNETSSEEYLKVSVTESAEATDTASRSKEATRKFQNVLDIKNTKNVSILLMDKASLSQVSGAGDSQELSECILVLAYDGGPCQQAGLRDLLLVNNTRKVVQINTTDDVQKMVSGSSMCHGYQFLRGGPEGHLTPTSNCHESCSFHDRTKRSPSTTGAGGTSCDNCSLVTSLVIFSLG
ncbi:uncharacterized protein [Panulirus ornatus]|uniref:uncharacterized protein n=1 Tax=Panulirus ornatus TaxID=150431 RepID=UPI003A83D1BD